MADNPRAIKKGERLRQIEGVAVRILTITRIPRADDYLPYYLGYIGAAKKQTVQLSENALAKWHRFEHAPRSSESNV